MAALIQTHPERAQRASQARDEGGTLPLYVCLQGQNYTVQPARFLCDTLRLNEFSLYSEYDLTPA